nr:PREDICTED: kinesin-like protein KIF26A [Latimeria chalumnae]|eukprot:XP_014349320.1 PREDICTED: kinesin-like protein KIF26A [Latimeria chalumnae]
MSSALGFGTGRGLELESRRLAVVEGSPSREQSQPQELNPRKKLQAGDEVRYGSRPTPEGAGAVPLSETGQYQREEKGPWCKNCQIKFAELKKQALKLAIPGSFKDPDFSALIFDKLQVPGYSQKSWNEGESRCEVCATHLNHLKQEAIQMIQALSKTAGQDITDFPQSSIAVASVLPRVRAPKMVTLSSQRDWSLVPGQAGRQSGKSANVFLGTDRRKGLGWPQSTGNFPRSSVQVTVAPSALSNTLSSVTIQAQQYLEGVWSISRVNSFLPQACLAQTAVTEGGREGLCSEVPSVQNGSSQGVANSTSPSQNALGPPAGASAGTSAAASFFISQKRDETVGEVKVMVRICPSQGTHDTSESMCFLKVDPRKKQMTLYDPSANGHSNSGHRRAIAPAVPKMFAFDAVFSPDASQAEVCSGTVAEVIQSVVNGADGCIFCFGHVKLGKSYTMIGKDNSTQNLGITPCAISWLFKLINERKEKTGTRFSVRVSAVEICGKDEKLKDLLSEVASGSLQDGQSPGVYLREDPICGTQLQNQSELRAPTAEKAAFFLDAAIAARSTSRADCEEEERRNSHMLFTLHIYQYRMEKSGKGGMSGGRSRLHLIDLGSCERVLTRSRDGGVGVCLSLSALGNVILALVNGAKHVPYKDSKLTMLLRESLGNINCRTTMIAHISDSPANYAETLTTVQLASRIHRMRKKKSKYASSSSGGESSCEEGRIRRPSHLRPFHPRTIALDPDLPVLSISSDPDYSSSSEQSCDTVIYVGPNGAALSDRELTDNEGPPEFVPIIPSLNKKRTKDVSVSGRSSDMDHFKCNTFAELQERLDCIDGSEEPIKFASEEGSFNANFSQIPTENVQSKLMMDTTSSPGIYAKSCLEDTISPKKGQHLCSQATTESGGGSPVQSTSQSKLTHSKWQTKADGGKFDTSTDISKETITDSHNASKSTVPKAHEQTSAVLGPVVREKSLFNKRPLPSPAPPPPQPKERTLQSNKTYPGLESSSGIRTPPVGMSHQILNKSDPTATGSDSGITSRNQFGGVEVNNFRSTLRGKCFDRDILTTTVTLQQPVELNGEDELVFTVVEELSIGGILENGRPASIISFNSDCSLQALASGSRPVSIISSINDEFDAYTSQAAASGINIDIVVPFPENPFTSSSRRSSISSWLSEVSICTVESDGAQSCDSFVPQSCYSSDKSAEPFNLNSADALQETTVPKCSLNDSGFCFSELESESTSSSKLCLSTTKSPHTFESTKATSTKNASCVNTQPSVVKANTLNHSQGTPVLEVVHCSLPRKTKSTSSATHSTSTPNCRELQKQDIRFEDPWLMRIDCQTEKKYTSQMPSARSSELSAHNSLKQTVKVGSNLSNTHKPAKSQAMLACSQRVVDGCEMTPKLGNGTNSRKTEAPSKMPQLKRGATTLGTMPIMHTTATLEPLHKGSQEAAYSTGSLKSSAGKKSSAQKTSMLPKPNGTTPPAPPVRKSSLDQKNRALPPSNGTKPSGLDITKAATLKPEEEIDGRSKVVSEGSNNKATNSKSDYSSTKMSSSLKTRSPKTETVQRYGSQMSLERCDSLTSVGSKTCMSRENSNVNISNSRAGRTVPRLGVPPSCPAVTSPPSCTPSVSGKTNQVKGASNQKIVANGNKNRGLSTCGSKSLSSSVKSLTPSVGKNSNIPPNGKTAPRSTQGVTGKPGRGTIMGTKQAIRAANSRVNELASGSSGKTGHSRGSTDSDSGNDSGINLSDEKSQIPVLPSPYSKITAPRRPQRYSSGHGSDNSSVLSGELPPAMGRTALFYHSGGSSGYESMIRDSEATGSASSAHDSMSESGMSSSGRMRSLKSPKKRSTGLQRRRLIPAPLPDASSLGRKPSITGQWVDLPPLPGTLKEPFEIKVYEIDDVERLQRHRQEENEQPFQDVEKGLMYFNTKLKIVERRHQRIKDMKAKYDMLIEELEETKHRLMVNPNKWKREFEIDPDLEKESQEYLEVLEQVTEELEHCVNLCKSRVMMVTCFDIGVTSDMQEGAREVEV